MKRFNILTLLVAVLITLTPNIALADIGGLTKCSESPAFSKRLKASVKKLEQRMATYEAGTPPALEGSVREVKSQGSSPVKLHNMPEIKTPSPQKEQF